MIEPYNVIRLQPEKDAPRRTVREDRGVHADRVDAVESRLRTQYEAVFSDIAMHLEKTYPDKEALRFFWWYRHEDEEVRRLLGLPVVKNWSRTNEAAPKI